MVSEEVGRGISNLIEEIAQAKIEHGIDGPFLAGRGAAAPRDDGEDELTPMTQREVLRRLKVDSKTLAKWEDSGVFPKGKKVPGTRTKLYNRALVMKFIAEFIGRDPPVLPPRKD